MMVEIEIDEAIISRARAIARLENIQPVGAEDRSLSGKGHTNIMCGAVGQAVFERVMEDLKIPIVCTSSNRDDYRSPLGRIEVKSKERAVAPVPSYEASVYEYNKKNQDADIYAFVSLRFAGGVNSATPLSAERYDRAWLCGLIERERFDKASYFVAKGTPLQNGKVARYDSHNVKISELEDVQHLGAA
jgi:hypothetical protein